MSKYKAVFAYLLLGIVITVLFQSGYQRLLDQRKIPDELNGILLPKPKGVPAFRWVDHRQQSFTFEHLLGKWTILTFGVTHCSVDCSRPMRAMVAVFERLKADPPLLKSIQWVFVSLDPVHDTPAVLKDYVTRYNEHFLGVTGPSEDVKHFSEVLGYGVSYSVVRSPEANPGGHTEDIYLFNPQGRLHALFQTRVEDVEKMLRDLVMIVASYS
ncbi:MAG: SCO family protein [Magnetococcales bacterium]|nr:SCO family protein [Magnetococcales bacterium]